MNLLFDHYLIDNYFDMEKAKYLLDLNNWKKNVKDFKEGYINIVEKEKGTQTYFINTGFSLFVIWGF